MDAALPLTDLVAVEIGHSVAVPFGGQILAQLGATLIKVEHPEKGDDARLWGPPFWHGASATFQALNRDKFGVVVDLKDAQECDRLRRFIVEHADIVIQNLRPGLIETFGLDGSLRRLNPHLIYCNVGAFGSVGPLMRRPGYDPLMQAFGGIMSITGEEGRAPVRVGPSIIDIAAGMWGVIGILAALRRRDATGEGCEVDTSLFETALAWMTVPSALYLSSGDIQKRSGSEAAMLAPYRAYRAADDYVVIAAGNDNLFRRLCGVLERPQWADDPRFRTNADRIAHRELLNGLIEEIVGREPRAAWLERLERGGVPCAPLQSIDQVLDHAQTQALGMIQSAPDGVLRLMGLPLRFDGTRPPFRQNPPRHGEHTARVFNELFPAKRSTE
jgi:crotonobetainyl-CoA:carnitine CoA-transferase CaiB-like acyl-CoA transferase